MDDLFMLVVGFIEGSTLTNAKKYVMLFSQLACFLGLGPIIASDTFNT